MSGIIYPTFSFLFLRVGLIPTPFLPCKWRGATIGVGSTTRVDLTRWSREHRPTIDQINTCLIGRVITALMLATWREEDRRIDSARRSHALIAWARSTDQDQHTCANLKSYNGCDLIWRGESRPLDRDPTAINQGVLQQSSTRSSRPPTFNPTVGT